MTLTRSNFFINLSFIHTLSVFLFIAKQATRF
jgi:hypothetical protein